MAYPNVRFVIDVDGFPLTHPSRFVVKELAYIDLFTNQVCNYYFQVSSRYHDETPSNQRQIRYVYRNVHGMRYSDQPGDKPQHVVDDIARELARVAIDSNAFIAYKGGQYETRIFERVHAAELLVNLEHFGCPKFDVLFASSCVDLAEFATNSVHCSRHTGLRKTSSVAHCPRIEVVVFAQWWRLGSRQAKHTFAISSSDASASTTVHDANVRGSDSRHL